MAEEKDQGKHDEKETIQPEDKKKDISDKDLEKAVGGQLLKQYQPK